MPGGETRKLAVVVVADLVGYTRMLDTDEVAARRALNELKSRHVEPVRTAHGGEILKRLGDGWIVAFPTVTGAIAGAMAVQEGLAQQSRCKLRLGGHLGEIVFDDTDFYGHAVNLAHRLQAEAPPGGLLISQDLHRQLAPELARSFLDTGDVALKGVEQPLRVYRWRPRPRGASDQGGMPLVAVEVFAAATATGEARALADDLRELLLQHLARRTGIRVTSGDAAAIDEPHYRLRGRVRCGEARSRVNLALVAATDGRPMWSRSYEGDSDDPFALCDRIVERADADLRL